MRAALGWLTVAAVTAACGRFDFAQSPPDADGGDAPGCVGSQCGVQCETNCFPFEVYRGAMMPPDWATAAAAVSTGEVHLLYVDPTTGGLMWMFSDTTLRHWSIPIDVASDATNRNFTSAALIRHGDDSLTALVLDARISGSTLYRRLLTRTGTNDWQPSEPLGTIPLPPVSTSISLFEAAADVAGNGGTLAFASDGGDTQTNAVYFTASADKFHTIGGLVNATGWDQVDASVSPAYFLEVRVASDSQRAPWVLYHVRSGTNDDAVLARFTTAWTTGLPGWGDPWHFAMSVAPDDTVDVTFGQEGTVKNPQHSKVTTLSNVTGGASIGNWNWTSAPANAYLRSALAREGTALRAIWEDPETATLSAADTLGSTWGLPLTDTVGPVTSAATSETCALVVAPEMINGTSHIFWRENIAGEYSLRYTPFTRCGGGIDAQPCAFDQACVAGACAAR